jgi:succinate dehydrogenase / fumarate reductase cytochrome b subunit
MDKVTNKNTNQRPKFLNLLQIRLPITAVASILHRISGILLFLILPFVIYDLGLSLKSEDGFKLVLESLNRPALQMLGALAVTAVCYHLISGIRFLLLDLGLGHKLQTSRWSARIVIYLAIIMLLLFVTGVVK